MACQAYARVENDKDANLFLNIIDAKMKLGNTTPEEVTVLESSDSDDDEECAIDLDGCNDVIEL